MKFLLDMGISPETGKYLIELGYEAVHLIDRAMERSSDLEIMDKALSEQRIILTHDLDFGKLLAFSGSKLPSVIIFRLRNMVTVHRRDAENAELLRSFSFLLRGQKGKNNIPSGIS